MKTLTKTLLTNNEFADAVGQTVFGRGSAVSARHKIRKRMSYRARTRSNAARLQNIVIAEDAIDDVIWKMYIRDRLDNGVTTGSVAQESNQELAVVNARLFKIV